MKFFKSTLCLGYLANIVLSEGYSLDEYQEYHSTPLQECLQNMLHCLEEPCDLECKCNLAGETLKCFDTCDSVLQTDQLYVAAKLNYNSYCSAFILDDNSTSTVTTSDLPVPTSDPVVDPTSDPVVDPTSDPVVDPTSDPVVDPTSDPVVDPTSDPVVDPTSDPVVDPTSDPVVDPTSDPVVDPTPTDPPIPDGFQAVNTNANTFAQESSHGSIYSTGTRMEVMWLLIVFGVMVL